MSGAVGVGVGAAIASKSGQAAPSEVSAADSEVDATQRGGGGEDPPRGSTNGGSDGPGNGDSQGPENDGRRRRKYDRKSRREHDAAFDLVRNAAHGILGSLGWLVQAVIVVAVLAGILGVPSWIRAQRRAAEGEEGLIEAQQRLEAQARYLAMSRAMDRILDLLDGVNDARARADWGGAGILLAEADSIWNAQPLSDCNGDPQAESAPDPVGPIIGLLCSNRRHARLLFDIEDLAIAEERRLVADPALAEWDEVRDSIASNVEQLEDLIERLLPSDSE